MQNPETFLIVPGHLLCLVSCVNTAVLWIESGTGNCLHFGVALRCSRCSPCSLWLCLSQAPPLCNQTRQFNTTHLSAPGLSGDAGEVNCAITCPRAQFLPARAVHLRVSFSASANLLLHRVREMRESNSLSLPLLSTLSKPKTYAPQAAMEDILVFL